MKNKFLIAFFLISIQNTLLAEDILIESKNITLNKDDQTSIFKDEVKIVTQNNSIINSEFAEYNKKDGIIKLKQKIKLIDEKNNIVETELAEYDENSKIFKTFGPTKILTEKKYLINSKDIILNNSKKFIRSQENTTIVDQDSNKIFLENFEYRTNNSIFKSVGYIKIEDINKNTYEFSQVYIDTKKKEILGTDIKAYMNQKDFKVNDNNKPRIFSNSVKINENKTIFNKSIFTLCDYRENDKCPPWDIRAKKMSHDSKKKTIYYENALLKVYDIPIFFS